MISNLEIIKKLNSLNPRKDYALSFLSNLGIDTKIRSNLVELKEKDDEFQTMIRYLDYFCPTRYSFNIGVIYVNVFQNSQKSILHNIKGSNKYEKFISLLGWENPYETLRNQQNPIKALNYSNAINEIVFHVSTRFENAPDDDQQIKKKKFQLLGLSEMIVFTLCGMIIKGLIKQE